eukprot:scaffold131109_cov69-Phaeocystis_antarctica.AAC.4
MIAVGPSCCSSRRSARSRCGATSSQGWAHSICCQRRRCAARAASSRPDRELDRDDGARHPPDDDRTELSQDEEVSPPCDSAGNHSHCCARQGKQRQRCGPLVPTSRSREQGPHRRDLRIGLADIMSEAGCARRRQPRGPCEHTTVGDIDLVCGVATAVAATRFVDDTQHAGLVRAEDGYLETQCCLVEDGRRITHLHGGRGRAEVLACQPALS